MNQEQVKRVTLDQLIARKLQREKDKYAVKEIYIPCLDATMLFKKISEDTVLDILGELDSDDTKSVVASYTKLIYLCCEDLQDQALHKEFGISDPFDVVGHLFGFMEVVEIGNELVELYGVKKTGEKIKNS